MKTFSSKCEVAIYYGGFRRFGGVNSHLLALEKTMVKDGHFVTVVTLDRLPFWCRYIPHIVEKLVNLFNLPIGFLCKGYVTKLLYRALFDTQVDIRIFEDIYISWNSEIPSVTVLHAVWSDNLQAYSVFESHVNRLKFEEVKIINQISHPLITVSYPYRGFLENVHFRKSLSRRIGVVELGIDQSNLHLDYKFRQPKSIVYTGALEARKNVLFMLQVFRQLSTIDSAYKLTIIGDGPEMKALRDFVDINELSVSFLGRLSIESVTSELVRHSIYLHTSTKESFSYALLEAKLAGLMTCAYERLQVPSEFIDIRVATFDIDDWCQAILSMKLHPKAFRAENYTVEKMAESTLRMAR
jgi:glycosyltransferase involved in cell wall biosynthesis